MRGLVVGQDKLVADFVASHIPGFSGFVGQYAAVGVSNGQGLIAGVVYNNPDPDAGLIEMSCAASDRRWLNRSVLRVLLGIPFKRGHRGIYLRVKKQNRHTRRFVKKLGFKEAATVPGWFPDDSLVIYLMKESDYERWR